jgi:hypothetical protein
MSVNGNVAAMEAALKECPIYLWIWALQKAVSLCQEKRHLIN